MALRLLSKVAMARPATAPQAPMKPRALASSSPPAPAIDAVVVRSSPPPLPKPMLVIAPPSPGSTTIASAAPAVEMLAIPPPPAAMIEVIQAYEAGGDLTPPSSGIRISEKLMAIEVPVVEIPPAPPVPSGFVDEPAPPSFQVYSLADLDRRSGPASIGRSSLTQLHGNGRAPHKWARSKQALSAVGFAFRSWVALGKARPPLRDAIHAPGQVLGIEVKAALRATDWKRVGTVGGIAAAVGVALLTLVLLVADLTDDMKPTHVGAAAAAAMIPAPPETTMMTPPPAPAAPIYEDPFVYDVTPAPIAVTKPKPRPQQRAVVAPAKPKIPKGKKPGDLLIPY